MIVLRRLRSLLLSRQLRRFVLVGLCAAAIDFSVFNVVLALLGPSAWHAVVANTLSFTAATCVGYTLNSRYTFGAARTRASFARYLAVAVVGVAIYDTSLFVLLSQLDDGSILVTNAAKVVAVAPSTMWNFVGFNWFVFAASAAGGRVAAVPPGPVAARSGAAQPGIATETLDGHR